MFRNIIYIFLFLFLFCDPPKYDSPCDPKSKTFKAFVVLRTLQKETSSFCNSRTNNTFNTNNLSVSVTGLVDATLNLTDTISNKTFTITQPSTGNLTQILQTFPIGTSYNLTITRPASHISCTSTNLSGTLNAAATVNISCTHVCTLNYSDIARIENWTFLQEELNKQAAKGSSGTETFSSIFNFGSSINRGYGSVMSTNGKIYSAPFGVTQIISIDPSNNLVNTNVTNLGTTMHGGVLAKNGIIYYMGQGGNIITPFNPITETPLTTIPIGYTLVGGIYSPNTDRIYTVPINANPAIKIDPNTNTSIALPSVGASYYGCSLAPNGMIYCASLGAIANILKINPTNDTVSTINLTGNDGATIGSVIAPSGLIYILPYSSTKVFTINPIDDSVNIVVTGLTGATKWAGGILAPNGKIYLSPETANNVGILDTNNNTFNTTTLTSLPNGILRFGGSGKIGSNGKIYLPLRDSQEIINIDTKSNGSYCESIRLSPNFNKF